jgi:hypothetical protein
MTRRSLLVLPAALLRPPFLCAQEMHPIPKIAAALDRQYNFDFPAAHQLLNAFIRENPAHPLGYTFRASAYLFSELDRLRILESEFLTDDEKIRENKSLEPDPAVRAAFFEALDKSRSVAGQRTPPDAAALFSLALAEGMTTDYMAFIEKRRLGSLSHARESQEYAIELMKADPGFVDAKLTAGISEYLIGSLPFFLRWFVRFPQTQGSKEKAVADLEDVARSGYYMGPFARILLAIIQIREDRPVESLRLLDSLTTEFPENPLLHREAVKLREKLESKK